ncbi:MAG: FliA/WhiG family RNA polymerase sigma factor [Planctomycetota bacterium]|nr:FliA/WhiG family RNA polymerase sigma factor [Planctomycetota bacterium]
MRYARSKATRAKAHGLRKKGRVAAVLYRKARRLCAISPVSTPLAFRRPASVSGDGDGKNVETPQQAARRHAKLVRRRHEDDLWREYLNGRSEAARNALWIHYQPLVRYISERLKAKLPECIDVCDLIGAGNIGLQDAISKFETSVGVRFETYCVPRIRGAILDSIRALDWVPRLIRNKNHQYERIVRELASQLHREPTDEEIARRLAINPEEFSELRKELNVKAQISVEGSNKDIDERDRMRIEMLEHPGEVEPTRELQRTEVRAMALRGLNPKERTVVEQYYFRGRSMKQIGEELKLSESRICQIHSGVLEVLRKKFRAYADSCYLG